MLLLRCILSTALILLAQFASAALGRLYANLEFDNGASGLAVVDGVLGLFNDGYSLAASDANDIGKSYNFGENIALLRNGTSLSIEAHPLITDKDTLFISTTGLKVRNYALQFKAVSMQANVSAILQDTYLNTETVISTIDNQLTNYYFTVTAVAASAATSRFRIVFNSTTTLPVVFTTARAFSLNSGVQVDWTLANENGIRSYEVEKSVDGISFTKATSVTATGAGSYGWYDAALLSSTGGGSVGGGGQVYYRIRGIGIDGRIFYSNVLKLTTHHSPLTTFSIYPNPLKGSTMNIQFINLQKGRYSIVVYNSAGQKVVSRDINHLGGSATEEINPGTMASGVYRVSLISNGGSTQNQTLVIQK